MSQSHQIVTPSGARRVVLALFIGSLLVQLAWILTVPPFRGIDEFDHAYRAAAVADGQWLANTSTPEQRGNLVTVPRSLVEAARAECYTYYYTTYDECNPVSNVGHGDVTVASSAARYNPVFYWIIGTPARAFSGTGSLFAMRAVASLICSLMIALIGWIITRWATSPWPFICLIVALTPEVMYTSMLPAPNGVEMLGGLGVWAALLGLDRVAGNRRRERQLIWAAAGMAVPLALVRSLGPLWLAMIMVLVVLYWGFRRSWAVARRNRRTWAMASALVVASTAGGGLWAVIAAPNTPSNMTAGGDFKHPLLESTIQLYVWVFQSFAAFPTRGEIPSLWIYAIGFNMFVFLVLIASRLAGRRERRLILAALALSLLVPWIITWSTYAELGAVWQGRYTLPFSLGIPVMAALVLDVNAFRLKLARPTLITVAALYAATYIGGALYVLHKEILKSPQVATGAWWVPPTWLVVTLLIAGPAVWALGFLPGRVRPTDRTSADDGHTSGVIVAVTCGNAESV